MQFKILLPLKNIFSQLKWHNRKREKLILQIKKQNLVLLKIKPKVITWYWWDLFKIMWWKYEKTYIIHKTYIKLAKNMIEKTQGTAMAGKQSNLAKSDLKSKGLNAGDLISKVKIGEWLKEVSGIRVEASWKDANMADLPLLRYSHKKKKKNGLKDPIIKTVFKNLWSVRNNKIHI